MNALATSKPLNPPPPSNPPQRPHLALQSFSWPAWRRDTARYYRLLGFKAVGIAMMVLLALALWLDSVLTHTAALSKSQAALSVELAKMQATVGLRKKIEANLKEAKERYASETQRGFSLASPEEAAGVWQAELQAQTSGLHISDAQISPAPAPKKAPAVPVVVMNVEFTAIPEQVVTLLDTIAQSHRLYRVPSLQLDISPEVEWPKLKVKLTLEAMYFQPDGKGSKPARPAAAKPADAMGKQR